MRLALLWLWPLSSPPPLGLVLAALLLGAARTSAPLPCPIRSSQELSIFRREPPGSVRRSA